MGIYTSRNDFYEPVIIIVDLKVANRSGKMEEGNATETTETPVPAPEPETAEMPSASDDDFSDEEKKVKSPPVVINKSMSVNKEYMEKVEQDRSTRFSYLLKQTEIFSHF